MKVKTYIIVGYALLTLFFAQEIFDLRWHALSILQQDELYKRWTGVGLLIVISLQWSLTFVRNNKNTPVATLDKFYSLHKWLGALSPLFFYVHSMKLGFMYLFFLSITFFLNIILGYTNLEILKAAPKWVFQLWMILHVSLSVVVTTLTLYHIVVALYYE
ncbi:MAG TPA: hypothetical protein VL947_11520 [Cytophagales bacterium]|nr:hypothetical protein [Cytophagales bacterium]